MSYPQIKEVDLESPKPKWGALFTPPQSQLLQAVATLKDCQDQKISDNNKFPWKTVVQDRNYLTSNQLDIL